MDIEREDLKNDFLDGNPGSTDEDFTNWLFDVYADTQFYDEIDMGDYTDVTPEQVQIMEKYICAFCLNDVELSSNSGYPSECPHCRVSSCSNCGSFLKSSNKFCYGCGELKPKRHTRLARSGSLSSCYIGQEWQTRNNNGKEGIYTILYTLKTKQFHVAKQVNGEYENCRILSDEEVKIFKELE